MNFIDFFPPSVHDNAPFFEPSETGWCLFRLIQE